MELEQILKKYYGYSDFRAGQEEIIRAILGGRDCLAVMPTGAGKSLCYQIPALVFGGTALVVSPLIALMRDQTAALVQNGIPAAYINSSLTYAQTEKALARAARGDYKIVCVAPERLCSPGFLDFARDADISMVAVDEAHCVSHWGQDFRPSYLQIIEFIAALPKRPPVSAFTATATEEVKRDIIKMLGLNAPVVKTTGFNRANLYFEVRRPRDKYSELTAYLRKNIGKSGIIYCSTRKTVDETAARLVADGFPAAPYHAGLSTEERSDAQDDFVFDRKNIIVATNAFGMGIDKSNVSFVIHYNAPKNMESYYQEAGRAGRDGAPAECVLFYSAGDMVTNRILIGRTDRDNPAPDASFKARDYARLAKMESYCKTTECLRRYILDYFGDGSPEACGNCGNCLAERKTVDITIEAQKILSCVYRINGRYGAATVAEVLRGAETKRLIAAGLDKIKSYGIMRGINPREIRDIIEFLTARGYLTATDDQYRLLRICQKSNEVLFDGEKVFMPLLREEPEARPAKPAATGAANTELFAALKKLRLKFANAQRAPAFTVFSDATLIDMMKRRPSNETEFLEVSGVGQIKLEKYGKAFLEVING